MGGAKENNRIPELQPNNIEGPKRFGGFILPEKGTPEFDEMVEMVFDDEDKYFQFVDYVYNNQRGRGIDFPHAPIDTAIRVKPWLLERTPDDLANAMHLIQEKDLEKIKYTGDDETDLRIFEESMNQLSKRYQQVRERGKLQK